MYRDCSVLPVLWAEWFLSLQSNIIVAKVNCKLVLERWRGLWSSSATIVINIICQVGGITSTRTVVQVYIVEEERNSIPPPATTLDTVSP